MVREPLEFSRKRNLARLFGVYAVLVLASRSRETNYELVEEPSYLIRPMNGYLTNLGAASIELLREEAVLPNRCCGTNLHWQTLAINKVARSGQKLQRPVCLWLTGLSGSGKSTIASLLEQRLFAAGRHTYVLENDNIRLGLNRDLGFSEADRIENIRRITEVAKLFVDAGLVVIVAFISPYRAGREAARSRFDPGEFLEVFVDAPVEECERRDPKGLYAKARRGELANFTGIDSEYEPPQAPDIRIDTVACNVEECVDELLRILNRSSSPLVTR